MVDVDTFDSVNKMTKQSSVKKIVKNGQDYKIGKFDGKIVKMVTKLTRFIKS